MGLALALLAGLALWPVSRRLQLRPESCAAAVALYGGGVLLVELEVPAATDGRAALLLAVAACLAVGGGTGRNAGAALACGAAVLAAPVAAVGFLVLLGFLAGSGGLARRCPAGWRGALAVGALVVGLAIPIAVAQPARPWAIPPAALAVLTMWTVLVAGLVWSRLRWLRPVVAAAVALLVCTWVPGPDTDAAVLVTAVLAVLTVVVAEELGTLLRRGVLVTAAMALAAATPLVAPGGDPQPTPVPVSASRPVGAMTPRATTHPVHITIAAIGVASTVGELRADRDGELVAPDDARMAGWLASGVLPGEVGPAVVGGHVDSRNGPGVFFGLHRVQPGDVVEIGRSDGATVRFAVTAVHQFPKERFPTEAVYGPTPEAELRLITCGGAFDRAARHYPDNVVVDAVRI